MTSKLFLIVDSPRDGFTNMAIDDILHAYSYFSNKVILRFYMWKRTTLTLGRKQSYSTLIPADKNQVLGRIDVTRRVTGGSALLHVSGSELTYSLVIPRTHSFYTNYGIIDSAYKIATAIANALKELGFPTEVPSLDSVTYTGERPRICLLGKGAADIFINGKKISGSAQYRDSKALLQHGVLLLDYNPSLWIDVFNASSLESERLEREITGLYNYKRVDLRSIIEKITDKISDLLELTPLLWNPPSSLTRTFDILASYYRDERWIVHGKKSWDSIQLLMNH